MHSFNMYASLQSKHGGGVFKLNMGDQGWILDPESPKSLKKVRLLNCKNSTSVNGL